MNKSGDEDETSSADVVSSIIEGLDLTGLTDQQVNQAIAQALESITTDDVESVSLDVAASEIAKRVIEIRAADGRDPLGRKIQTEDDEEITPDEFESMITDALSESA